MVINGLNLPSIGFMRAKPMPGNAPLYTLAVYPPGPGGLAGANPATMIELKVDEAEVRRIIRAAPHLVVAPRWLMDEETARIARD